MAEPPSPGSEDKKVTRENSGKWKLGSPARSNSKKSSNPFAKILSLRKSSSRKNVVEFEGEEEENKAENVIEQIVETVIEEVIPQKKAEEKVNTLVEQAKSAAVPLAESTSSEIKDIKAGLLSKFNEGLEIAKGEVEKVKENANVAKDGIKEELRSLLQKDKPSVDTALDNVVSEVKDVDIKIEEKLKAVEEKAPNNLAQRLQEEVLAVVGSIAPKEEKLEKEVKLDRELNLETEVKSSQEDTTEKLETKEENCVSSLAQGLQSICASWTNAKKED